MFEPAYKFQSRDKYVTYDDPVLIRGNKIIRNKKPYLHTTVSQHSHSNPNLNDQQKDYHNPCNNQEQKLIMTQDILEEKDHCEINTSLTTKTNWKVKFFGQGEEEDNF